MAEPQQQQGPDEETVHHQSARQKRSAGIQPARMQLNLTSMIDVIFQLLIYFVVTATFAANEGVLSADLPEIGSGTADNPEPPKEKLHIDLNSYEQTSVRIRVFNQRIASFQDLHERLLNVQHYPEEGRTGEFAVDDPIVIRPTGRVRWQHVVNAFNAAVRAQYENISFAASGGS